MNSGGANSADEGAAIPLASRRVELRPLADTDYREMYALMVHPGAGGKVRFGGSTPSPEQVTRSLWDSVLAQFIVSGRDSKETIGLFVLSSANFRDGHVYMSAIAFPELQHTGLMVEGVMLGINYAFSTWPFRKIYMEVNGDNLNQFGSALDRYFEREGQLRDHVFFGGRYQDMHILAMWRETWQENAQRYLARMTRSPARSVGRTV